MIIKDPKFKIGDRVFHVTRDSDEGVIINSTFRVRNSAWIYSVTFKPGDNIELYEDEISSTKIF